MIILGDVHGKWNQLNQICARYPERTIMSAGDVGVGFPGGTPTLPKNFVFIRGNHDNPDFCKTHPQCLGDSGFYNGVYFVAGADSIDKASRTAGINWWQDEQLSTDKMYQVLDEWCDTKPDVLVCHEAPWHMHKLQAEASALYDPNNRSWGEPRGNSTAFLLEAMISKHMPKMVIHGHWHNPLIYKQWRCVFVSLGELEPYDLSAGLKYHGIK